MVGEGCDTEEEKLIIDLVILPENYSIQCLTFYLCIQTCHCMCIHIYLFIDALC